MRVFLDKLYRQTKTHKADIEDSELPEGEKALQIETCKTMMRYFSNRKREYIRDSAKLLQDRNKDK